MPTRKSRLQIPRRLQDRYLAAYAESLATLDPDRPIPCPHDRSGPTPRMVREQLLPEWRDWFRDRLAEHTEPLTAEQRQLVQDNYRLAHVAANKFSDDCGLTRWERRSAGYLGICFAAIRFDEARGGKFSSYAVRCARGFILREMRQRFLIQIPEYVLQAKCQKGRFAQSAERNEKYAEIAKSTTAIHTKVGLAIDPEDHRARSEGQPEFDEIDRLREALMRLDERRRFLLTEHCNGRLLYQIGEDLGIGDSRAGALYHDGIAKLRQLMDVRDTKEA